MNKRSLMICLVLVLSLMIVLQPVSANIFTDIWGKITGQVVDSGDDLGGGIDDDGGTTTDVPCSDSDGNDIYTYGTCTNPDGSTSTDSCLGDSTINEIICSTSTGLCASNTQGCPTGYLCSDGACIEQTIDQPSCIDSDGNNISIQGTCTDSTGDSITDSCLGDSTINEIICSTSTGLCASNTQSCPTGQICSEGACIESIGDDSLAELYGCDLLDGSVLNETGKQISLAQNSTYFVILKEGATLKLNDYVVLEGNLAKLFDVYNNSGPDYALDRIAFKDVLTGETYNTRFTSEGTGIVTISGKTYSITFSGTGEGASVWIDYPGTGENEIWTFEECDYDYEVFDINITNSSSCVDTDRGKNYFIYGYTHYDSGAGWGVDSYDVCLNDSVLKEQYCSDSATRSNLEYTCENGCVEGACVADSPTDVNSSEECDFGCYDDGKCYPIGFRSGIRYCDESLEFVDQKNTGGCNNHFECATNICIEGSCTSPSLLEKIINFFRSWFS